LVVGIIAILAGIVIIAINPSKQLAQVRNTERKSDLKQIANAITQFYIDHSYYPTSLIGDLTEICDTGANASSSGLTTTCNSANLINLSELVPTYLTAIPKDPSATTTNYAGYRVIKTGNKIGLSAPAELGQTITIGTVPEVVAGCGDPTNPDCWSTPQSNIVWSTEYVATDIKSDTLGLTNTNQIVVFSNGLPYDAGSNYPAAKYCYDLNEGGHDDWYLPAKQQLIDGLTAYQSHFSENSSWGGFAASTYCWSSTELSEYDAWSVGYYSGDGNVHSYNGSRGSTYYQTRCFR